jgi:hypothetical protein
MRKDNYWTDDDDYEPLIFHKNELMKPLEIVEKLNKYKKELEAVNEALTTAYEVANKADDINNETLDKIHMILKEALK